VRINSPGGSVFDGVAIYNALKRHSAGITVWSGSTGWRRRSRLQWRPEVSGNGSALAVGVTWA
jgi:hypothetical protein